MSGDVQPRKRKDKKKKKDELSLEEPRGTAAALGEGDVLMHSYSDHGTGGHWCAKVIFFSLLAVLITLIGLIILENRGLSELEANAVESQYSGLLEGWLEDAPDDDHHDEHTLELKHPDDEEDDHYDAHDEHDEDEEDEHEIDDEEHEDDEEIEDDEEEHENDEELDEETKELDLETDDEDEDNREPYKYYADDDDDEEVERDDEEENENDDEQEIEQHDQDDEYDENNSNELENEGDDDDVNREDDDEEIDTQEDEEEHEDEEEDEEVEVEKIELEASEEEPISTELPALPEDDDDDDNDEDLVDQGLQVYSSFSSEREVSDGDDDDTPDDVDEDSADDDFLEVDDEPAVVERISAPSGKPFVEVEEDEASSEKPPDTLEEEEEYEKQEEERRKEEERSSHMWLKLSVGGALLVATHALVRRAAAPRDEAAEEHSAREETPVVDRRMTLIPEETSAPVVSKKVLQESASSKSIAEEIVKQTPTLWKPTPIQQDSEEEVEEPEDIEEELEEVQEPKKEVKQDEEKELYSDEEEDEEEVEVQQPKPKETQQPKVSEPEPDDEVPDDVEIIDDEQLEEEFEEEEDEDDVSDVDDAELLSRLEAKYGRLPEPDRPGQKNKEGGQSLEDDWPGEPSDSYWRQELDSAEQQLRQGDWAAAARRAGAAQLRGSARARHVQAAALDAGADQRRDNALLARAIAAYLDLLKMHEHLPDDKLIRVARRTLDRIHFIGNYLNAEPVYRLLIRRFPDEPAYRNNLTISFLMANKVNLAEEVLKETLARWPNDRVALAHYGFVIKTTDVNRLEEAVDAFERALAEDRGPACEPRFYYHYGDALLLLGRYEEAHEVHKRAAKHGHFLSPAQRSLYNVPRLKSKPWWNVNDTPYSKLAAALEKSWKQILKEGEAAKALYEKEKEGLKDRGDWSQMDLFIRGKEIPGRCKTAPVTCAIVRAEAAAATCRRGQIKFSAMQPGTHVRPHVGPTNCRLRMHLGLSNTKDTYIRVDKETRQWKEGKVLLFDDSFEHEVWHNGTGKRLVLIVDVWHPDLTAAERRTLPAI